MSDESLPDLPASDSDSLNANAYDSFYDVKTREFWGQNRIVSRKVEPYKKCSHHFIKYEDRAECEQCHMGIFGTFDVRNGILYMRGEPVKFN